MNVGGHRTLPRFARTERVKRDKVASAAVPKLQRFIKGVAVTMGVSATARPVGFVRQLVRGPFGASLDVGVEAAALQRSVTTVSSPGFCARSSR